MRHFIDAGEVVSTLLISVKNKGSYVGWVCTNYAVLIAAVRTLAAGHWRLCSNTFIMGSLGNVLKSFTFLSFFLRFK